MTQSPPEAGGEAGSGRGGRDPSGFGPSSSLAWADVQAGVGKGVLPSTAGDWTAAPETQLPSGAEKRQTGEGPGQPFCAAQCCSLPRALTMGPSLSSRGFSDLPDLTRDDTPPQTSWLQLSCKLID